MSNPTTIYHVQYCSDMEEKPKPRARLSMVVQDDKETIYRFADIQAKNRKTYPVCVWTVYPEGKQKTEEA